MDATESTSTLIGGSKVTRLAGHYPKAFAATIVSALQEQFDYETRLQQRQRGEAANYEVLAVEENPTSALPVVARPMKWFLLWRRIPRR